MSPLFLQLVVAQPKQCFVCTKFAENKGKTLFSLLVFTQLFRQEIKNAVFFAQFTWLSRSYVLVRT